jgi:hypothetical protein
MFKRVQQSLDGSINIDNTVCGQILSTSILQPVIIPTTIFLSTDWGILWNESSICDIRRDETLTIGVEVTSTTKFVMSSAKLGFSHDFFHLVLFSILSTECH